MVQEQERTGRQEARIQEKEQGNRLVNPICMWRGKGKSEHTEMNPYLDR